MVAYKGKIYVVGGSQATNPEDERSNLSSVSEVSFFDTETKKMETLHLYPNPAHLMNWWFTKRNCRDWWMEHAGGKVSNGTTMDWLRICPRILFNGEGCQRLRGRFSASTAIVKNSLFCNRRPR